MVTSKQQQKLYIVFDKLPKKNEGGLVATYINLVQELRPYYQIEFVGIFDNGRNDISEFENIPLHVFSKKDIDNRFFNAFNHLKQRNFRSFFHSLFSGVFFFGSIPINKIRSKKLLKNQMVIASSPAAAMFLSRTIRYILEIHTTFDYFWGKNILGRMQSFLLPPATITVFRNKHDALKGEKLFPSTYIYNAFNTADLPRIDFDKSITHSALFVGRLAPEKNPLRLLECAQIVKGAISDFTLDIYGDGPLFLTLQEKIKQMGLQETVYLKGFVDNKAIYQKYDLLWITSTFEGFGLVVIEAMANGIPCVSTNWGEAVFEIIHHEKTGYIANSNKDFATYSINLLTNKDKYRDTAVKALELFQQEFTCRRNTEQWKRLLQKIYETPNASK